MSCTHTYVVLELTHDAYKEIAAKLRRAGYDHAFDNDDGREVIDMHGIAVTPEIVVKHASDRFAAVDEIIAILRKVKPPLSRATADRLMLFEISNRGDGELCSAFSGPNRRFKRSEAEELCKEIMSRVCLADAT